MKKKAVYPILAALVLVLLMTGMFSACGRGQNAAETAAPAAVTDSRAESPLHGTWQTASMGFEADGTMVPEYHVQFTDSEIVYGHMKDGAFVPDHSDKIARMEETAAGGCRVQAEASNGVQYTYQTSEGDNSILEYFETWNENEFPDMYRGGASLSRSF